jgi:hypothetical protein
MSASSLAVVLNTLRIGRQAAVSPHGTPAVESA